MSCYPEGGGTLRHQSLSSHHQVSKLFKSCPKVVSKWSQTCNSSGLGSVWLKKWSVWPFKDLLAELKKDQPNGIKNHSCFEESQKKVKTAETTSLVLPILVKVSAAEVKLPHPLVTLLTLVSSRWLRNKLLRLTQMCDIYQIKKCWPKIRQHLWQSGGSSTPSESRNADFRGWCFRHMRVLSITKKFTYMNTASRSIMMSI